MNKTIYLTGEDEMVIDFCILHQSSPTSVSNLIRRLLWAERCRIMDRISAKCEAGSAPKPVAE